MKKTPLWPSVRWLILTCSFLSLVALVFEMRQANVSKPAPAPETATSAPSTNFAPPAGTSTAPVAPVNSIAPLPAAATPALPSAVLPPIVAFRQWLADYLQASPDQQKDALEAGLALAQARRPVMAQLIRSNPEAAIQEALHLNEWEALPVGIRAEVEKPFSEPVNYNVYPVCKSPNQISSGELSPALPPVVKVRFSDGTGAQAFIYGGKNVINSKDSLPTQGIALDGVAALRDGVFQTLNPKEAVAAAGVFPSGQPDLSRSFVTGQPINGEAVTALAGGRLFAFASTEELQTFDKAIAKLDAKPGPHAGSRAIFELPYRLNTTGNSADSYAFNFAAAEKAAIAAATNWTTTKKKVFLIRVVISGTSSTTLPSQSELQTVINGTSTAGTAANSIYQFSYGKTWAEVTVSSGTYVLSKSATDYYLATTYSSDLADEMLEDARAIFRAQKTNKGDSGIKIGTGTLTVTDTGSASDSNTLGDYDVVGIQLPEMSFGSGPGIGSGGWAGLASVGGRNLWMQGYPDASTYKTTLVHEMGHIYGLAHSSFWQTTDNSVVGSGTLEEYGDLYDVMGHGNAPQDHFHPQAKQRLSWIDDAQWADASAQGSGLYRIYQFDSSLTTGSLRGVRLTKGSLADAAESDYYWVGYRPTHTESQHFTQGAYLLWERFPSVNDGDRSTLLDTTPLTSGTSKAGKADAPVDIGRTYSDSSAKIHITPIGYGDAGGSGNKYLDVQINVGTLTTGSYTASVISSGSVSARTTTTFSASTTLSSSAPLAYFWDAGDGSITGGSGASAASFTHTYVTGGTYTINLTVSDMKGATATASASVDVQDPAQKFASRTSGTSADINAVAASPTLIVAVGDHGSEGSSNVIRTSPDGIVWTERAVAEATWNLKLNSVIWDGARFIAVGQDYNSITEDSGILYGVIYTSEIGLVWKRCYATSQDNTALNTVCCGNGIIVAAGNSGTVLLSDDGGTNWSPITEIPTVTSGSMSCRGLTFGSDLFVLTAQTATSSDGKGGISTSTGNGVVCTSPTGKTGTWTEQTIGAGFSSTYEDFQKIAYLNGKFIASGWLSGLKTGSISNGTLTFSTSRTETDLVSVLGYASGLYFASGNTVTQTTVGSNTTTAYTPINLYSIDGGTWKTSTPTTGMSYQNDGIFFNNRLISVGSGGAIYQSNTLATTNNAPVITSLVAQTMRSARAPITLAVTATDADGDSLSYRWDAGDGVHSGTSSVFTNTYAAGGTYSVSLTVNDGKGGSVTSGTSLVVSDPAQSFTLVSGGSATASGTVTLNGIASSGSLAVAVGDKGKVVTSTDGKIWTDRTLSSPTNMYLQGVAWDGTRFVAVGLDYASGWVGVIHTSTDGITWSKKYTSSTSTSSISAFRSVAGIGGTLLVGGDAGRLLRSTDGGTSWTSVSSGAVSIPTAHSVTGLAYGSGTFVATSHTYNSVASGDGQIYTSADGSTWTAKTSGSGLTSSTDLNSIAYLNDRFVGSGWYSKLRVSTDNGATFTTTRSTTELTTALAYGGGVYLAAGVDQDSGSAKIHVLSTDGTTWTQSSAPTGAVSEKAATFFNNTFLIVGGSGQIWQSGSLLTGGSLEILTQPTALTLDEGSAAAFSVLAVGSGTLSYQWKKDGSAVSGGTGSSYTISSAATSDSGSYSVQITDSATSTSLTSARVALLVNAVSLQSGSLVSIQPPSNVALVKGSEATLAISLFAPPNGTQTTYTLYSGTATALAVSGSVSATGVAYIPLKSLTDSGSYSVRFERTSASGKIYDFSRTFNLTFATWDSAVGTYQALLANGSAAATALNDGSVYRGLLTVTVSRSGTVSGRLQYNEATLLSGGTSGERVYAPIVRNFSGRLAPKPGVPSTMTLTPKLGTTAQAARQSLTIEFDLSQAAPTLSASLSDFVSLQSGTCVSAAANIAKAATSLSAGSLSTLVGKYLLAANVGEQAFVQTQVVTSGRVLWNTRLKGYTGTGTGYLNTTDLTNPSLSLYEGRQVTSTKLHNSTSLLAELNFNISSGSLWAASLDSGTLEKQASYLLKSASGTLGIVPVYSGSLFALGTNSTGVTKLSCSHNDGARWCGASSATLPTFLPTATALTLSVVDPQVSGPSLTYSWAITISTSAVVSAVSNTASDGTTISPVFRPRLDRTTGLWSGFYIASGARRTFVGASIDSGTSSSRAAQGWIESGVVPSLTTGTWTLSK